MIDKRVLLGKRVQFRLVNSEDAEYIQRLRTSPNLNRHLSAPAPTVEAQRQWIERYKAREDRSEEFYFVIERVIDANKCGLVRIYNISGGTFTWGSWILDENKPTKAALDSALIVYRFAFDELKCTRAVFDVRLDNQRTLAFHRRFGAAETGSDDVNAYFCLDLASFNQRKHALIDALVADGDR